MAVLWSNENTKRQRIDAATDDSDPTIEALLNLDKSQPHVDKEDGELAEDDEVLQVLVFEYLSQDNTSSPISAQLAASIDQSWSATLPDAKLK